MARVGPPTKTGAARQVSESVGYLISPACFEIQGPSPHIVANIIVIRDQPSIFVHLEGASIMSELYKSVHLYPPFHEKDALAYSLRTGLVGLGAGLFSACMKNAFFTTSTSPWTVVTQYGSTIPIYGINCTNVVADNKPPQLEAMDSSKQAWPTFENRMMDGMNSPEDFPLALSGECSVL